MACTAHIDHRVVSLLVKTYPDGLHVKDVDGDTPVDIILKSDFSPERAKIIEVLTKQLNKPEEASNIVFAPTELYTLIEAKEWDDALRHILQAPDEASTWVGSCQKKADARFLPLHTACLLRAPLLLIAVLIQTYPDAVRKKSNVGKLPIHYACERRADHRVVAFLVHTWPESLHVKDDKDNTPTKCALLSKPSPERTRILETLVALEEKVEEPDMEEDCPQDNLNEILDDTVVSRSIPSHGRTTGKKKSSKFFGKKKKDTLWEDDSEMFT